jgi:electron transfer flavoprotein alpha subunit
MTDVLVIAELLNGEARKNSLSAVTLAKQVAEGTSGAFDILSIGEGAKGAAASLSKFGARKVLSAEIAGGYFAEKYAPTIAEIVTKGGYGVVTACASSYGKDLLPRLAARVQAGNVSDITEVKADSSGITYVRPMYAGNAMAQVKVSTPIQVVTVRQTEFAAAEEAGGSSPVEDVANIVAPSSDRVEFVSLEVAKSERPDLAEAAIVVSGGRGVKSAENFKNVIEPLADALGAAVGTTRAAVDAGYVSGELQVGQTGKIVAPNLYIACGISGAIQHLAGMKGSKVIVAINKDNEAPIAQIADYFLVADLLKAAPELTEKIKAAKSA